MENGAISCKDNSRGNGIRAISELANVNNNDPGNVEAAQVRVMPF